MPSVTTQTTMPRNSGAVKNFGYILLFIIYPHSQFFARVIMSKELFQIYNVNLAVEYGLTEAIMLSKIAFWQSLTNSPDGYCWRTAKEIQEETSLTQFQQDRAIKHLKNLGFIDVYREQIPGGNKSCNHFKITDKEILSKAICLNSESKFKFLEFTNSRNLNLQIKETSISSIENLNIELDVCPFCKSKNIRRCYPDYFCFDCKKTASFVNGRWVEKN